MCCVSRSRRPSRAKGSSSAMSALSWRSFESHCISRSLADYMIGKNHSYGRARSRAHLGAQFRRVTIKLCEARAGIRKSDSVRYEQWVGGEAGSVVGDDDMQPISHSHRRDFDVPFGSLLLDAVTNGILEDGLQAHVGYRCIQNLWIGADAHLQTIREAELLDR